MFGLREAKLTVLDDLAIERGTDWVQEKLYELIDPRYRARQPTVGTTNAGPKALEEQIGRRAPPGL
jgi:DNA replication protein DnaC